MIFMKCLQAWRRVETHNTEVRRLLKAFPLQLWVGARWLRGGGHRLGLCLAIRFFSKDHTAEAIQKHRKRLSVKCLFNKTPKQSRVPRRFRRHRTRWSRLRFQSVMLISLLCLERKRELDKSQVHSLFREEAVLSLTLQGNNCPCYSC